MYWKWHILGLLRELAGHSVPDHREETLLHVLCETAGEVWRRRAKVL